MDEQREKNGSDLSVKYEANGDISKVLNNLTRNLLDGRSGFVVYDYGRGERLTTQYPAYVNNRTSFFIQLVTPISEIYSKIDSALIVVASIICIAEKMEYHPKARSNNCIYY
ncbi:MAG TPA: hypothetical protein VE130_15135 [Nitrososphaeraceae archaeon]|nr:hypothetical protein [Nitrososphaeraceae archaeon]